MSYDIQYFTECTNYHASYFALINSINVGKNLLMLITSILSRKIKLIHKKALIL